MSQTYDTLVMREWVKLIEEQIADLTTKVTSGVAIPLENTEQHYRHITGKIYAYRAALDLLEQAQKNVAERT